MTLFRGSSLDPVPPVESKDQNTRGVPRSCAAVRLAPSASSDDTVDMIVVQGVFHIAEHERERFLAESLEAQRISRGEKGCIEYVFAADPLDSGRVVLSERWETRGDLDAHIAALTKRREDAAVDADRVTALSREVVFLEATEISLG